MTKTGKVFRGRIKQEFMTLDQKVLTVTLRFPDGSATISFKIGLYDETVHLKDTKITAKKKIPMRTTIKTPLFNLTDMFTNETFKMHVIVVTHEDSNWFELVVHRLRLDGRVCINRFLFRK